MVILVVLIDLFLIAFEAVNFRDLIEHSVAVVALLGEEDVLSQRLPRKHLIDQPHVFSSCLQICHLKLPFKNFYELHGV